MNNSVTAIDKDGQRFTEIIFNTENWKQYLFSVEETMVYLSDNIKELYFEYDILRGINGNFSIDYSLLNKKLFKEIVELNYEEFIVLFNFQTNIKLSKSIYYNIIKTSDYKFPTSLTMYFELKNSIHKSVKLTQNTNLFENNLNIHTNKLIKDHNITVDNLEVYEPYLPQIQEVTENNILIKKNMLYYTRNILYTKYNMFTILKKIFYE